MAVRLFDISLPLSPELLVWPGDPPVEITKLTAFAKGDPFEISHLHVSTHTGTHVDPPAHFLPNGKTADAIDLQPCLGPVLVAALPGRQDIVPEDLQAYDWNRFKRVLFKTRNTHFGFSRPFRGNFTALTPAAAEFLTANGVVLVGIDYLSIEREGPNGFPVHHHLLKNNVVILEGIQLAHVQPGVYTLVCLPLKIKNGDGGPARALLLEGKFPEGETNTNTISEEKNVPKTS
jgi:arylformamidase